MVDLKEVKKVARKLELDHKMTYYESLQRFMFERLIERISVSKYKNCFILKGGLLLSALFGIDNRTTKDMDAAISGIDVTKDNMIKVLNEIFSIDLKDGVKFDFLIIKDIREEDEYGGNKYSIEGKISNLLVNFDIDISTGDKITPSKLKYSYPLLFSNKKAEIYCYNLETIVSEKIETILRRNTSNTRMKDYYDIFFIITKLNGDINKVVLKEAIINTFNRRESIDYLRDYKQILDIIKNSKFLNDNWNLYIKKYEYAREIEFVKIIDKLDIFLFDIIKQNV